MAKSRVHEIIKNSYDEKIADKLIDSYIEIEENFFIQKWKPSELDAGHFVETVRRIIEFEISGTYTAFDKKISNFSDATLKHYEQQPNLHESFRLLIPRILKAVYNIRNKRGVGHIKDISPNEMDSTLILYSVKWVLSEIIRLKSSLSIEETQKLIDKVIERNTGLIWNHSDFKRILNPSIPAKDQVLILLYEEDNQHIDNLKQTIEYRNASNFKTLIKKLHSNRFLEFKEDGICILSPNGRLLAEELILKIKSS